MKTWKADVVLHDGAPNVGKNWVHDAFTQSQLVLHALKLATEFLMEGGTFVTKVFRSADYNALMYVMKKLFKNVQATKPKASRNTSAEIFVVCRKFLAPKVLDPKLLNPKYVFAELDTQQKSIPDVLNPSTKRKKALGYSGSLLGGSTCGVNVFIEADHPAQELAKYDKLTFDEEHPREKVFLRHPDTTQEIQMCMKDLRVLGKRDFRKLMKWRLQMRELYEDTRKKDGKTDKIEAPKEKNDEEINEELTDAISTLSKSKKKKLKKETLKRKRMMEKAALGMGQESIFDESPAQHGYFSVSTMNKKQMEALDADEDGVVVSEEEKEDDLLEFDDYDEMIEESLDNMYNTYMEKKGKKANQRRKMRELMAKSGFDLGEEDEGSVFDNKEDKESGSENESDEGEEGDDEEEVGESEEEEETNPILYKQKEEEGPSVTARTAMWFEQPLFQDMLSSSSSSLSKNKKTTTTTSSKPSLIASTASPGSRLPFLKPNISADNLYGEDEEVEEFSDDDEEEEEEEYYSDEEEEEDDDDGEDELEGERPKKRRKKEEEEENSDFEVVEKEEMEGSDVEDLSDYDEDEVAQALALGQAVVNRSTGKIKWDKVIDDGFHRWTDNNNANLPSWFSEEDKKHYVKQAPVTKEDVHKMKQKFIELNSRPIKKVAEAKARKKFKEVKRMEKLKAKAALVANNSEMSEQAKMKELERLAKRQQQMGKRPRKQVIVRRNFQGGKGVKAGKGGGKAKCVDRRLLKDTRSLKAKEKREGGKNRKRKRK